MKKHLLLLFYALLTTPTWGMMNHTVTLSQNMYTPNSTLTLVATVITAAMGEHPDFVEFNPPSGVTMTPITPSGNGWCVQSNGVLSVSKSNSNGWGWGKNGFTLGIPSGCGFLANGTTTFSFSVTIPSSYTGSLDITWNSYGDGWACSNTCNCGSYTCETGTLSLIQSTLPIVLKTFTVDKENGSSKLRWTTGEEINSQHFKIQRSIDAINFSTIDIVSAKHNTTAEHNKYEYQDKTVPKGKIYYRLELVDTDNSSSYSKIIDLFINAKNNRISLSPNPFSHNITIQIDSKNAAIADILISDLHGRKIFIERTHLKAGANEIKLALDHLALKSNLYVIHITQNSEIKFSSLLSRID